MNCPYNCELLAEYTLLPVYIFFVEYILKNCYMLQMQTLISRRYFICSLINDYYTGMNVLFVLLPHYYLCTTSHGWLWLRG